jgi:PD-(D/E)XK nuclease superfamily
VISISLVLSANYVDQSYFCDAIPETMNFLQFVGWTRNENAHTRMIARLLDQNGPHEEGRTFIRHFLELVVPEVLQQTTSSSRESYWIVENNKKLSTGKEVDLFLACPAAGCAVVIENKIDAIEGENQVSNYQLWLDSIKEDYKGCLPIVYFLTPEGREACSATGPCYSIGCTTIAKWLETCLLEIKSPMTKSVVQNYLDVVRELIPSEGRSDAKLVLRKCPHRDHALISEQFLRRLEERINRICAEAPLGSRPLFGYRAVFGNKNHQEGKYHAIRIAPREVFDCADHHNLLWLTIEVILSNKKMTNVYIGPTWSIRPVREEQYDPATRRFVAKCARYYPLVRGDGGASKDGFWWPGFRERLIEGHLPNDNSLVSILKRREDRLHQRAVSLLEKHIEQFGKDIAALNDELRRRTQDVASA